MSGTSVYVRQMGLHFLALYSKLYFFPPVHLGGLAWVGGSPRPPSPPARG